MKLNFQIGAPGANCFKPLLIEALVHFTKLMENYTQLKEV